MRQSVISYRCKECSFITKDQHLLKNHRESHNEYKCQLCEVIFKGEGILKQHMLNEHKERMAQLNCNMCSFQSNNKKEFINHFKSHGESDTTVSVQLSQWKCRTCNEIFENKGHLMEPRRDNHEMPACRDDLEDRCSPAAEIFYYKHKSSPPFIKSKLNIVKCYSCQEEFKSLGNMMEHRKENHPEVVQPCSKAATGECQKEKCWYMHSEIKNPDFHGGREPILNP